MKSLLAVGSKTPAGVEVAVKKVTALRFGTVHIADYNSELTKLKSTEGIGLERESAEPPVSSS